ncbi:hypothetical protein HPP92_006424 [Vanilla planifolia]|uniref:Uncharacterized protein n=1 Tax=Vanilla planifolia TaxID=51239 RepID=A0A835RC15_VANPL|nr:hypothetical protein HPP92_006424 [Vanilla planifolia]
MEVLSLVKVASPTPTPPQPKRISPHSSNPSKDSIFFRRTWPARTHFRRAVAATLPRAVVKLDEVWPERMEEDDKREVERKGELDEDEVGKKKTLGAKELEELEAAAMEGKDEGREPSDYDRRARIFYESSRVFGRLRSVESS